MRRVLATRFLAPGALLLAAALSGCATDSTVIAVLAADDSASGRPVLDVDRLRERVDAICTGCEVEVLDAAGDAGEQSDQLDRALAAGADFVVLDPVDVEQAEALAQRAGDVPVLAYGTLVPGADWFVGLSQQPPAPDSAGSDLEAARAVISRDRKSFTHVPAAAMSAKAADVVVGELADEPVGEAQDAEGVPSWLFEPVEVTVNDLTTVLVASGAITLADLCEGDTAKRCTRLGLV
ncbi:hypothetical protein [Nocardioides currus]|uniref:ABC transporter substrate-binding protein n=1 Tax=Nocardioides currus TaxID=2133958 RepID=A0A2R7YZI0_9ACTN|nr:hypothetical protein [Nocardioides currus]PUA81785.1 hypothetical protein C7S10_06875 [Nocardioides currus]